MFLDLALIILIHFWKWQETKRDAKGRFVSVKGGKNGL